MYWRRPLTRLESALYAALFAIFVGVFAERAFYYMAAAEEAAVQTTVSRVNSGLRLRFAAQLIAGKGIPQPQAADPFQMAGVSHPPNFRLAALGAEGPGWTFDAGSRELVYEPQHARAGARKYKLELQAGGTWALVPLVDGT